MSELTQAERYLLEGIRRGDADAWSQLVQRYQGRLVAFAQGRLRRAADAEDLVQETFLALLKALAAFRGQAALETYLFTILRRKIIDKMRGSKINDCLLQDVLAGRDGGENALAHIQGNEPTASWYAQRSECSQAQLEALGSAMLSLIEPMKQSRDFRDLQIVEMLFYCQLPNKEVARLASVSENHVALIKHRCLKQVAAHVASMLRAGGHDRLPGDETPEAMLTAVWQQQRFSCLKRSTIGAYLLGTLESDWRDYAEFHLNRLGCTFCRANLDDLRSQNVPRRQQALQRRILQSTVGFLRKP